MTVVMLVTDSRAHNLMGADALKFSFLVIMFPAKGPLPNVRPQDYGLPPQPNGGRARAPPLPLVPRIFSSLGLYTPASRALAVGSLMSALLHVIKPELMFYEDGTTRPWVITSPDDESATYIPWWTVSVASAFVVAGLV